MRVLGTSQNDPELLIPTRRMGFLRMLGWGRDFWGWLATQNGLYCELLSQLHQFTPFFSPVSLWIYFFTSLGLSLFICVMGLKWFLFEDFVLLLIYETRYCFHQRQKIHVLSLPLCCSPSLSLWLVCALTCSTGSGVHFTFLRRELPVIRIKQEVISALSNFVHFFQLRNFVTF